MDRVINQLRMLNLVRKRACMSTTITVIENIDGWSTHKNDSVNAFRAKFQQI